MRRALAACVLAAAACGGNPERAPDQAPGETAVAARGFETPVMTNADSPVRYPPALFSQRVEGTVILRLHVDAAGRLVADSTRVAESSGHPGLDSAALAGVSGMQFAPARRDGAPVAATFLQPVHFRHPAGSAPGGDQ